MKRKELVFNTAFVIYNKLLSDYELWYKIVSDEKKIKELSKQTFSDLFLDENTFGNWSRKQIMQNWLIYSKVMKKYHPC